MYKRQQRAHTLVEEGGRGSLKGSFCSVEIVRWLRKWPQSHALVMRQMGNTLEAVSYTHLDVYKRQASARPVRKNKRGRFGTAAVVRRKVLSLIHI